MPKNSHILKTKLIKMKMNTKKNPPKPMNRVNPQKFSKKLSTSKINLIENKITTLSMMEL